MKFDKRFWRTIAIIFIVLFIIETVVFGLLMVMGGEMLENESVCAVNICNEDQYTAYLYDDYTQICYCFVGNDVVKEEYIVT